MRRLWRSIIQPHLDYACLLWSPVGEICEIKRMESVLRAYTKKGIGLWNLPYNERLKKMGLMSQERRVERYKILYLKKMLLGKVPNLGITVNYESRNGPILELKRTNRGTNHVKVLRDRTLLVEGVKIFNMVPRKIREYDGSYLGFKNCIDKWLNEIPDIPRDLGNEPYARNIDGKPSNSLKDWSKIITFDDSWVPAKKTR